MQERTFLAHIRVRAILAWATAGLGILTGTWVIVMSVGWANLTLHTTDKYLSKDDWLQSLAESALVGGQLLGMAIIMGALWLALEVINKR